MCDPRTCSDDLRVCAFGSFYIFMYIFMSVVFSMYSRLFLRTREWLAQIFGTTQLNTNRNDDPTKDRRITIVENKDLQALFQTKQSLVNDYIAKFNARL